jgi:hypothetical protein
MTTWCLTDAALPIVILSEVERSEIIIVVILSGVERSGIIIVVILSEVERSETESKDQPRLL